MSYEISTLRLGNIEPACMLYLPGDICQTIVLDLGNN